ncbi:DUF6701 domain-containing protein [Marinobacter persicus]|uniref:DUF6701 domain-containing protein n=1 Tax=Marinobacter persicus TaxID=930118 RepID=UPI001D125991|nr:DUF6701 domain-containing protein [Marinobacter persicus]
MGFYTGGDGDGTDSWLTGGGGGSSAGSAADGQSANGSNAGSAPFEGGDGGAGGGTIFIFGGSGEPGGQPGGGGGGAGSGLFGGGSGGYGGDGQVRIIYRVAPQCSAVFDANDGINENVQATEQLDLSVFDPRNPQPWPGDNTIPAGANVFEGETFDSNNIDYSVDGQARVLVDGDLTIDGQNFTMNKEGNARDLLLIVDGDLTFKNNAEINAVVYVTGNIDFKNNSVIVGVLAAEGSIDIGGGKSEFTYDDSAAGNVDFGGACIPDEPSVVLDHIRIVHPGIGLTCQASDLQVLACADPGCESLYPDPVDLTLRPVGWLPAQNVTVTGAANLQFRRSVKETVTLGVSNALPAPDNGTVCIAPDGSGSCDMTFRDVAFVFDMPDLVAGEENKTFSMSALETDENTGQCTALFAGETRTIEFGTSYLNPGPADREASFPTWVNGNQVATDGVAQTGIAISFDGDGVARDIPIRYNDAGRKSLLARYVDDNQPDSGTLLIEGTGEYVSVPLGLCLIPEQQCTAADLSCSNTLPAGLPFSVTPRAYRDAPGVSDMSCADKPSAPSFAVGNVPVSHQLLFPDGGADDDLLETTLDYGDGEQSLTLTEVGVFSINTEAVAGGYLGRDVPASDMAMTARMVPDQLVLTVANDGELSPECNGFVYTGEKFQWDASNLPELHIEALNGQTPPQRTVNYTHEDVIARLPADRFEVSVPDADNVETLNDAAATPVPFRSEPDALLLSIGDRDSITDGVVRYRFDDDDKFIYPKLSASSRIEPFLPDLTFLLQPMSDLDDVPVTGIDPAGEPIDPIAAFEVRYGRLSPQNVYGPENIEELTMPLQMEYWNGDRFILSEDIPGCTGWSTANITSNTDNHHNLIPANGTFDNGLGGPLVLKANGSEGVDTLVWGGVPDWKKDDLDGDGTLDDPTATATFGVYRGHDRIIYWRESTD